MNVEGWSAEDMRWPYASDVLSREHFIVGSNSRCVHCGVSVRAEMVSYPSDGERLILPVVYEVAGDGTPDWYQHRCHKPMIREHAEWVKEKRRELGFTVLDWGVRWESSYRGKDEPYYDTYPTKEAAIKSVHSHRLCANGLDKKGHLRNAKLIFRTSPSGKWEISEEQP